VKAPNKNIQEQIEKLETFMFKRMSKEAMERYGRVKAIHLDAALHALIAAMQEIKEGKYQRLLDHRLKALLRQAQNKR